ncbi:hypothetical protein ACEUD4_00970 [Aeromonas media]|uniref:hypothetical protein n=1 Tax=Aeromonas media TaxID=651 RepID=UPI0038CF9520
MKEFFKKYLLHVTALIVLLPVLVILGVYIKTFGFWPISASPERWGVFGDYIGGTLNSMFSFFSFIALLYTIHLQQKELSLTRIELKASAQAQTDSAIFAATQNDITNQQLINAKNNEKKNDIYNLIKLIDEKISNSLIVKVEDLKIDGVSQELYDFIIEIDQLLEHISKGDKYHRKIKGNKKLLENINDEITYLFKVIHEFDSLSGTKVISDYYISVTPYNKICDIVDKVNKRDDLW